MEIMMDAVKVLGRIVTILPFLLFIALYMGKRSIGELPVFDLLVILVLGSVVGADIADPEINHIHTVVAMIGIALLQKFIVFLKLKNRKIGNLLTFEPTVVIYNGQFLVQNMKKINYSIDNVLQMLREKDVFSVEDVEIAIIEANGSLSHKPVAAKSGVTREDLNVLKAGHQYEIPVILDGVVQLDLLRRVNKSEAWLKEKLLEHNLVDTYHVFYGAITSKGELFVSLKGETPSDVPPFEH
ncbi:DUF421 domain-containing protein [Thalassobacillus sp. CUG 92003]|uniref:DUF421 domain-containing protein n=1 Tax=Thalassobacillus sp. CUG 92003 TaxID=2736641 RepID=UPI0015E6B5E2|nr:DUF421 domain-containing protein [Thalassobacillus sp. CUG 92003]